MKVIYAADVCLLEEELIRRLERRPRGGLLDPVLVIVPNRRLVTHLERLLSARLGALLGAHLLTYRELAVRVLEQALEPPPRLLSGAAEEMIARHLAGGLPGAEGEHLRQFGGARRALLRTLRDLREAGIEPGELEPLAAGGACPEHLPLLYRGFVEVLERLDARGLADESGLIRRALPHVPRFLASKGIRASFHHGAYEILGINLELLHAVDASVGLEILLPAELEGPAFAYAARLAELLRRAGASFAPAAAPADSPRGAWLRRLQSLYSPGAALDAAPPGAPALEVRHTQGPEAELGAAVLRALSLHAGGPSGEAERVPLEEIAIVARSLEPYVPFLESAFERAGLPFTSSASWALARRAEVATFLKLLRALAGGLERAAVIRLLRSPGFRAGERAPEPREVDLWDRWSRSARIVSGLESWRDILLSAARSPQRSAERADGAGEEASVRRLFSILTSLDEDRRRWFEARSFAEHRSFLEELRAERLEERGDGDGEDGVGLLLDALDGAARTDAALGKGAAIGMAEVLDLLEGAAAEPGIPIEAEDRGGVRVLDLLQARSLHHRVVIWLGFHHGAFPRRGRADPYLSDAAREALALSGKPLALKGDAAEEKLLLAMTLAGARERLAISFQRADDGGRKLARSSALREVARVFAGKADARLLLHEGPALAPRSCPSQTAPPCEPGTCQFDPRLEHISAHPGQRALEIARSPALGLLPPEEAVIAAAVAAQGGAAGARAMLEALGRSDGPRAAALAWVERLESFAPGDGAADGRTGIGLDTAFGFSPSNLERLARCPLSFFLRDVLGVRELEEDTVPHRLEANVLGSAAHEALAELYRRLEMEGLFAGAAPAVERAFELLPELWTRSLEKAAGSSSRRLRGLFRLLSERWLAALRRFVEDDLKSLHAEAARPLGFERDLDARLQPAPGLELALAGRLDRLFRTAGGLRVDDYKTSGKLEKKLEPGPILKGQHLQLPLYRELAAAALGSAWDEVEPRLLGIGPEMKGEKAPLKKDPKVRGGFLETVAVAVKLAREGRFPLHDGSVSCSYCGYRRTCRKSHVPTLERLEADPALADFRDCQRKSSKKDSHTLEGVRRALAAGELDGGEEEEE